MEDEDQVLCLRLKNQYLNLYFGFFSFCNLVLMFCLCNCFGISSSLQFLQFGICVQFLQFFLVIFCLPLLQHLVFRLSFSFCNLVFLFCLCNCFGNSSSLQFLQFGICVQFLQKNLEWYFIFRFCKVRYFDFPSASAIWYLCSVFAIILVFLLLFSFCNLVFAFSFCNFFWSDILSSASAKSGISTFLQLLQFDIHVLSLQLFWYFIFSLVSAIWYLRSVSTIFLE